MKISSANMNVLIKAVRKAAKVIIRDFGEIEKLQVSLKGPGDFVTASDKKVEEGKIRFVLLKAIGNAVIEDQIDDQILRKTLNGGEKLCL